MKKGAALSAVLAPGGMTMFWVTQAVWATAGGMSHTADINAPARTTNMPYIFISQSPRVSWIRLYGKYVEGPTGGQGAAALERARPSNLWVTCLPRRHRRRAPHQRAVARATAC